MTVLYKKILVPLDDSAIAAQAVPHAQALATFAQAEVVLFRVLPDFQNLVAITPEFRFERFGDKATEALAEEATSKLQTLADDLKLHHISASFITDTGDAASKIVEYAAQHDIDLIVMSTHGRTGLTRWAYGSVASKVLGAAHCPVLFVRSQL